MIEETEKHVDAGRTDRWDLGVDFVDQVHDLVLEATLGDDWTVPGVVFPCFVDLDWCPPGSQWINVENSLEGVSSRFD